VENPWLGGLEDLLIDMGEPKKKRRIRDGVTATVKSALRQQLNILDKKKLLPASKLLQIILSADAVPINADQLSWIGLTVNVGQSDVHSAQFMSMLAAGLFKESKEGYQLICTDEIKAELRDILKNGILFKGVRYHLTNDKYVVCFDLKTMCVLQGRFGVGTGSMDDKCM
jgi:hypothetical protein